MAKQTINLGTAPSGSNGDTTRVGFIKSMANFDELYARTSSRLSKDISGAVLVNLTDAEALAGVIELQGVINADREVTVPASPERLWVVWNSTSGTGNVKFRTQGGQGPSIERGTAALVYSNGTDVLDVDAILRSRVAAMPDKAYVDDAVALKADKSYVDNGLAGKISTNPGKGGGFFLRGDGAWSRVLGDVFQSTGSTQPGYECHIPGVAACMTYLLSDGNMIFANSNGSATWVSTRAILSNAGNMSLAGSLSQASDAQIKADIQTIEGALAKVRQIRGVTYRRMLPSAVPAGDDEEAAGSEMPPKLGDIEVGVIAQEVQAVCPELVSVPDPQTGILAVAYGNMVGLLLQAINELAEAHDAAVARIAALEAA
ncbi:tail fiber domain-containing protein [Cupriavidus sp. Marseille-Q8015]